jgi:hypothetical protein
MLLAQVMTRYGFFGIHGFVGVILGFIVLIVVVAIIWQIGSLLLAKAGLDPVWAQIIRLLIILLVFLLFIQLIFNVFG